MNVFSSVITLLLTSAVAANKAHDVISSPQYVKFVSAKMQAKAGEDYVCEAEVGAFFTCLGPKCTQCFVDIFMDLEEDTTCEDLEAGSYCADVINCIVDPCADASCDETGAAMEDCLVENYSEEMCEDLCEPGSSADEEKAVFVQETVSKEAVVQSSMAAHEIMLSKPHVAKAIKTYESAAEGEDFPCHDELVDYANCLGEACINCMYALVEDMDESTTCEDLENGTFCADANFCITSHCSANDCTESLTALAVCAEKEYPEEAAAEPECPDLCGWEDATASIAIA